MTTLAFFYGSLRKGFRNHYMAQGAKFLGFGQTTTPFRLYVHFHQGEVGIPTAIPDAAGYPLKGEVYELTPRLDEQIKWLERGYDRNRVDVQFNDALKVEGKFAIAVDGGKVKDVIVYTAESLDKAAYWTAETVEAVSGDYADYCSKAGRRIQVQEPPIGWLVTFHAPVILKQYVV